MTSTTVYRRGDIVTVPFPFTNLRNSKLRPALVISVDAYCASTTDVVLAQITSAQNLAPHLGDYPLGDWNRAGLNTSSVVRAKVFTLHRSLITRQIGQISVLDLAGVEVALRAVLGL